MYHAESQNHRTHVIAGVAVGVLLGTVLLGGCASSPNCSWDKALEKLNSGDPNVGIIQNVCDDTITINGTRFALDPDLEIRRRGYSFDANDLCSGWLVELRFDTYNPWDGSHGIVTEVTVLGIPHVTKYPEYKGLKTRMGVGRCRLGNLPPELAQSSVDIQSGIESLMLSALQQTRKFIVIDLRSSTETQNETDRSNSRYGSHEHAINLGRQVPADYIVRAHVLSFGLENKGGGGFGLAGFKVGKKSQRISLKMELTVEDVETGVTTHSYVREITYDNGGTAFGFNVGELMGSVSAFTNNLEALNDMAKIGSTGLTISTDNYYSTPIGEVIGMVTNRLVSDLYYGMADIPWSSVVVNTVEDTAVIRGGSDVGLRIGDELVVHAISAELTDPETGLSLGNLSKPIGVLTVHDVRDEISICTYHGRVPPSRGDKCKLVKSNS